MLCLADLGFALGSSCDRDIFTENVFAGVEKVRELYSLRERFFLAFSCVEFQFFGSNLLGVIIVVSHKFKVALSGPDLFAVGSNSVRVSHEVFRRYFDVAVFVSEVLFNMDVVIHMFVCTFDWVLHCSGQFESLFMTSFQMAVFRRCA